MSQNVFNPAVLVLYLWPTVSWVAIFSLICKKWGHESSSFLPPNVIVCSFVIFIPASSSPMLHCSVIPHCLEKHLVVSFFSLVHCSFLSSVISCVEGGISCLFWPRWCLAPEQNELLWMGESQAPPLEFIPTASVRTLDSISPATSPFIFISRFLSLLVTFLVLSLLPDLRLLQYS